MSYQIHEEARRHAYNALAEVHKHLNSGKIRKPEDYRKLHDIQHRATNTLRNLDDIERYNRTGSRQNRTINDAMDAINDLIPFIDDYSDDDDYSDVENRRGVARPGTRDRRKTSPIRGGKGMRRRSYRRADMDDMYNDDYSDDDYNDVENRRGGARRRDRYGRFTRADLDDRTMDDIRNEARAEARAEARREMDRGILPSHAPVMPNARRTTRTNDDTNDTSDTNIGPSRR